MYVSTGLAAITPASALRAGYRVIPVPMRVRESRPGSPALFIVGGRRAGLGDDVSTYDIAAQLNLIQQGALNGLGVAVEQGTALDPATYAANLLSQAQGLCSGRAFGLPADRCVVPTSLVNSLASQYAAAYSSTVAAKRAAVSAGDICGLPGFLAANPGLVLSDRARVACGYGSNYGAPPPVVYTQTGTGSGSGTAADGRSGGLAPSVRISNLSRPGQSLQVGDTYLVKLTGPANAQVTVMGTQSGKSMGSTPMGSTDSTGNYQRSAVLDGSTIGTWSERWTVGDVNAGVISFTVSPAPSSPPPAGSGSGSGSGAAGAGSGAGSGSGAGAGSSGSSGGSTGADATGGVSLSQFFNSTLGVFGYDVPYWVIGLAVAGGAWAFTRGKH